MRFLGSIISTFALLIVELVLTLLIYSGLNIYSLELFGWLVRMAGSVLEVTSSLFERLFAGSANAAYASVFGELGPKAMLLAARSVRCRHSSGTNRGGTWLKDESSDQTLCPISMASACGVDAMLIAVTATMAEGALRNCAAANLAIAVTGVCGPQPDEDGNPVGLAFVAVQKRGERAVVERHQFPSQSVGQIRGEIMRQALQLSMSAMHS